MYPIDKVLHNFVNKLHDSHILKIKYMPLLHPLFK